MYLFVLGNTLNKGILPKQSTLNKGSAIPSYSKEKKIFFIILLEYLGEAKQQQNGAGLNQLNNFIANVIIV